MFVCLFSTRLHELPLVPLRQSDLINAETLRTQDAAKLFTVGMGYIYGIISEKGKRHHDKNGKC